MSGRELSGVIGGSRCRRRPTFERVLSWSRRSGLRPRLTIGEEESRRLWPDHAVGRQPMRSLEALYGRLGPRAVHAIERSGLVAEAPQLPLKLADSRWVTLVSEPYLAGEPASRGGADRRAGLRADDAVYGEAMSALVTANRPFGQRTVEAIDRARRVAPAE